METAISQVTRRLHEEHVATLALCSRLEATLAAGKTDPVLMRAAAAALAGEIERHFAFEESDLFPRLRAAGEGELADLLHEEHVTIRAAAQQFPTRIFRSLLYGEQSPVYPCRGTRREEDFAGRKLGQDALIVER